MGAYFDLTSANAVLKELYFGQTPEDLVYRENPALALLEKKEDAGGKYIPVPIIYGVSQGRSSNFSNAQGNQTPVLASEFLLTRASDYSIATIDNQTMLATKGDKSSFVEGLKTVVDGAYRSSVLSAASSIFRSGTGSIGQVNSSGWTSGVATLTNPDDIVQFDIGMTLQDAATDGAAPRAALGYVIGVDTMAGTITVSATGQGGAAGTPSGWAASEFLLVQGDSNSKAKGFAAWLPTTAPATSDNFFGVNRSASPTRLAGVRLNGSNLNIEEAVTKLATYVAREGGHPNYLFTTFTSWAYLEMALGAKVQYEDIEVGEDAQIMFRGIRFNGPKGEIKVVPDRNAINATGHLLTMDTWKLYSLNPVPHLFRYADGLEALRVYNQDAAEARVGYYAQVGCAAPGWNGVVTLPV